jgi:hypothetical protein
MDAGRIRTIRRIRMWRRSHLEPSVIGKLLKTSSILEANILQ